MTRNRAARLRVFRAWSSFVVVVAVSITTAPLVRADVEFVDVAATVGLDFTATGLDAYPTATGEGFLYTVMGTGAAVGDYDDDGDLDVYLLNQMGHPNALFRNDHDLGLKQFTDVTPPLLADTGFSRTAHFADLDNDGDLDILLINDDDAQDPAVHRSRIFRNDGGGSFSDATAGSGFRPTGYLKGGCALGDYDQDGLIDVYVTNWGFENGSSAPGWPGSNRLFRNLGDLEFSDVTESVGLGTLSRDGFSAVFVDQDEDGDDDLYVAFDHTSDEYFENEGGVFTNVTNAVGATHTGNDMGVAVGDYDNDSDLDLYTTNITDPFGLFGTTQGNALYENRLVPDGSFGLVDSAATAGVTDTYWGWGTDFLDAENDGDLDLVAVSGYDEYIALIYILSPLYTTPTALFLNDGTGSFTREYGTGLDAEDDSRALVVFDYDRDGDLDMLVTNRDEPVKLFENQSTHQGSWMTVRLSPDWAATGATIRATTGATTRRRDIVKGRSYLAGTPSEASFGLGSATIVDTLEIEWSDGLVEVYSNVAVDALHSFEYGATTSTPVPSFSGLGAPALMLAIGLAGGLGAVRRRSSVPRTSR